MDKEPLAVLFAVDKDDEGDCNPILIAIGNKDEVEAKKIGLEAALADFEIAMSNIYTNNPYRNASELGIINNEEYRDYLQRVGMKIRMEIDDLMKDKPPYYNHTLIMLSQ